MEGENPICCVCGKPVTRFIKSTNSWWKWCSNKCMGADPEILEKKVKTNLKKFGSDYPMHSAECKKKLKDTFLKKYGVDNPSKSEIVKKKMRSTFLKKYGVDNPSKNKDVIKKIKDKAIDRFASSKDNILKKRRNTYLKNTGCTSNKYFHISPESQILMKNLDWLVDQHINQQKSITKIAEELGISTTPISNFLHSADIKILRYNKSEVEKEIVEYIQSLGNYKIILNNRNIIGPKEIDILIPEINLAVEVDGVYWHSESKGKDRNYHLFKTAQCEKEGIHLLHIYDIEWNNEIKQKIIKSKISHLFNKSNRIFARKCKIKEVSVTECNNFLNKTHMQGTCLSKIKLGLYFNNQLQAIATFGKARYNKLFEWELLRYSNNLNTSIVGGLSKLISFFTKNYNVNSIISYADRRWTMESKNLYNSSNFTFLHTSSPNYKYFNIQDKIILLSRNQFQKHMIKEKLQFFDKNLTEYENMLLNHYDRIWDCGNLVYFWKKEVL